MPTDHTYASFAETWNTHICFLPKLYSLVNKTLWENTIYQILMGLTIVLQHYILPANRMQHFLYIILRLTYIRGLIHGIGRGVPNVIPFLVGAAAHNPREGAERKADRQKLSPVPYLLPDNICMCNTQWRIQGWGGGVLRVLQHPQLEKA